MKYGSGSFSGKYLLSSPIRIELIQCQKYRYRVHRSSYNHHRACHHQAIYRCRQNGELPTILSSNQSFLIPTLVDRFYRRRWYHWVSYICIPQGIDANPLFLVSAQSTSLSVGYLPRLPSGSYLTFYIDTLKPATNTEIPTVTDNLFSQGTISAHEIAISFEPLTEDNELNGELTWGVYNYHLKPQLECKNFPQVEPTAPNSLARLLLRTLFSTC